jgi:RHS repeat-associated protein
MFYLDFKIKDYIKMRRIIFILGIILTTQVYAQVGDPGYVAPDLSAYNYIKNVRVTAEGVTDIDALNENQSDITYQYFDGLGRVSQTIVVAESPNKGDIVQFFKYDNVGRQVKQYLPYTAKSVQGGFRTSSETEINSFYSVQDNVVQSPYPVAKKVFDNSPLNRITEQGAPGADWQPEDINIPNSGHTIKINYLTNTSGEVIHWIIDENGNCLKNSTNNNYPANSLYKSESTDENGNTTCSYSDNSGKTILKKSFNTTYNADGTVQEEQELCTYYVYDDFERLRYVLPPLAVDAIGATSSFSYTNFEALVYYYEYDHKNRLINKKIPGAEIIHMVYDRRNNLVLSQDGNLRAQNEWMFTKYDKYSRPIFTGILFDDRSLTDIRHDFTLEEIEIEHGELVPIPLWEDRAQTGIGYTLNNSFTTETTITEDDILSITYYDDYDFLNLAGFPYLSFDNTANNINDYNDNIDGVVNGYFDRTKGQVTGTMVKVLDGGEHTVSANKIFSTNYYDDKNQLIQFIEQGYDNSENFVSNQYDFTGNLLFTKQIHNAYTKEIIIDNEMQYDHAGRLQKTWQTISGEINRDKILIAEMHYNELGQLIKKKLNENADGSFLQDIDYDYNIRGWLNQINDPLNLGPDLFGMKLLYNDIADKDVLDGTEQYNGNISGMIWNAQSIATETVRAYGFTYDKINRLTAADYGEYTSTWDDTDIKYNVPGISYDKNGNILSLIRYGETGEIDNLSYAYENSNYSNRLNAVNDAATADGFSNAGSGTNEYTYDFNGNMTNDDNKGLSNIQYNILNLPEHIEKGTNTIEYIYDATGSKLVNNLPNGKSYIYLGNFVYNENNTLEYILMNEGRVYVNGTSALYEYYLKDHLGNTRVVFDETGATPAQTTHYYPFGMQFNQASIGNPSNKYLYNGKEIQEETDWYDYGARMYDPVVGRFFTQDRFAEMYLDFTPYQYGANNPILYIDVNGDSISVAEQYRDLFNKALQSVFGENTSNFSYSSSNMLIYNGDKKNLTKKQKKAFKGLNKIMGEEKTTSVVFENSTTVYGTTYNASNYGGGVSIMPENSNTILVDPNVSTSMNVNEVLPAYFSESNKVLDLPMEGITTRQTSIQTNTNDILWHEIGEVYLKGKYTNKVLDYNNNVRAILKSSVRVPTNAPGYDRGASGYTTGKLIKSPLLPRNQDITHNKRIK